MTGRGPAVRVVIAEDSAILRDGLAQLLELRGIEVVAAVDDAERLLAAVDEHRPDAAVVDIRLPPGHSDEGLRAAVTLRSEHPGVGVLIFSQYVETKYAARLLGDGAAGVGYLLKERVVDIGEFAEALRRVAAGAQPWTRRSSPSCSGPPGGPRSWTRSPRASARCWP